MEKINKQEIWRKLNTPEYNSQNSTEKISKVDSAKDEYVNDISTILEAVENDKQRLKIAFENGAKWMLTQL